MRQRVEAAARFVGRAHAQETQNAAAAHKKALAAQQAAAKAASQEPTIKLSMDFSAFQT